MSSRTARPYMVTMSTIRDVRTVTMATLPPEKRKRLADTTFALPSRRAYPIPDIAHARNALARVAQHGTPVEQAKVRAAVYRKFPELRKPR